MEQDEAKFIYKIVLTVCVTLATMVFFVAGCAVITSHP